MKVLLILCCALHYYTSVAQQTYAVIVIDQIPLTIQATYHLDKINSDRNISHFFILSDSIQVALLSKQTGGIASRVYDIQPPFSHMQLQHIAFRHVLYHQNDSTTTSWLSLFDQNKSTLNYSGVLAVGDKLVLPFKYTNTNAIVQATIISRLDIL